MKMIFPIGAGLTFLFILPQKKNSKHHRSIKKNQIVIMSSGTNKDKEWQTAARRQRQRRPPQWTESPLMVEYIPETPVTTSYEPFIILLVGLPGSGKTTFAHSLTQAMPYKFVRINQDELKSRRQCIKRTEEALDEGLCPIIDRCNFDAAQRKTWYDLAKKYKVAVNGIILQVPINVCISRCQNRHGHETIKPEDSKKVVNIVKSQLKLPSHNELNNIHSLLKISNSDSFNDAIVQYLNKQG
jgi:predicted kinase